MTQAPQDINRKTSRLGGPALVGSAAIALTFAAFFSWASLAPLHGAVMTTGLVKTETNRKAVQHSEGGVIKAIHVREGETVTAGQALVDIESVSTDANYQLLRELTVFETLKRDRLDAEQQLARNFAINSELVAQFGQTLVNVAYQREQRIFAARRETMEQQLAILGEQLQAIEKEHHALRTRVAADRQALKLTEDELAMNRSLESQQFVSKTRVLALQRGLAEYQGKLGEDEGELAQTDQRINEVKLRMAAVRSAYQRTAAEEFKESAAKLVDLRERLRPVDDAMKRKTLTAPVSGRTVAMRFNAPGEIAGPREVLMEIVPDNEVLILEGRFSVDDIRRMRVGQPADIRFTAFNSRTTPIVTGKVTYISADALTDRNGMPFFVAHVQPEAQSLQHAGITSIQAGMAAEMFVLTEGRTTLDYLFTPITETLQRSMRQH